MGWRDLSNSEREMYFQRSKKGESLITLAQELDANPETLSRTFRKYAQDKRGGTPRPNGGTPTGDDRVSIKGEQNTKEIESVSDRITTLEQLIEYCQIDTAEWIIDKHVINKWEVGRKDIKKNLSWEDGTLDGYVRDEGGISVAPLFQIKVWLTKRNPDPVKPVIQPININTKFVRQPQKVRGLQSALIIPDIQFGFARDIHRGTLRPFHDRLALDIVAQLANVIEPDRTIFLGDLLDFSGWSDKFIRRPEFYFTTQPSLIEAAWYVSKIRELTRGDVDVIDGNHDIRPETMIINHLMEAYQLRSADRLDAGSVMGLDNLLGLSRMSVNLVTGYPDSEVWINDETKAIHGSTVRGQPGQTAAAVARDANENTIFGHVHRREQVVKTIPVRGSYRTVTAFTPGCLCHVDGRVPGSSKSNQWQQGAAVVWFDEEHTTIVPIEIYKGKAVYEGVLYQGKDYLPELKKETRWEAF